MNIQYLLVLLFACAAGGMTYVLAGEPFRKPLARARMSIAARKGMHAKPTQRMKIAEAIDRAGEAFEKVIPLKLSESRELQDKLDLAGLKITPSTWRAISLGITIFTAIMLAGAALVGGYGIAMALLVGIIGAVGGWAVCGVWLSHAGKTRGEEIDRYLPPALELLTISVSAGVLVERGLSSWCHLAYCGDQIWRDAYAGAGYPVRDTNFFVEAFKLRIKYGNGFIENNADFGAICYAGCMGIENSGDFSWSDVCRDGEELGKGGVSNRITGIKIWLEGDIAKEYDIAYRAFIYGQGWTERFHSNGGSQDDAELCGSDDASGSKGAIKCIQVFAIPKPRGAKLAREFAEDNSFIPENSHSGGYLTAQAMLALNLDDTSGFDGHKMIVDAYQGDSSKGLEALPVPPTPPSPVGIKVFYYVDGETDPCFEEEYEMGTTYQVNPDATAAGQKDNCLDLVCWYTDPEYTQPYESQELATSLKLYGYNPCSVKYDTTSRSSVLDTSYNWSTDADLGTALDLATLYPQDEVVKYGTKLTFAGPWSAWCEDAGKTRCVSSTPGVYANAAASGSPILSATIKGNTTVYVDWPWSGYDGVMSARL